MSIQAVYSVLRACAVGEAWGCAAASSASAASSAMRGVCGGVLGVGCVVGDARGLRPYHVAGFVVGFVVGFVAGFVSTRPKSCSGLHVPNAVTLGTLWAARQRDHRKEMR